MGEEDARKHLFLGQFWSGRMSGEMGDSVNIEETLSGLCYIVLFSLSSPFLLAFPMVSLWEEYTFPSTLDLTM